jgi:hypothetical protein
MQVADDALIVAAILQVPLSTGKREPSAPG